MPAERAGAVIRRALLAIFASMLVAVASCSDPAPKPTPVPTATAVATATAEAPAPARTSTPEPPPTATVIPPATPTTIVQPSIVPTAPAEATPLAVPTQAATPMPPFDSRRRGGVLNIASWANIGHQDVQMDVSPALSTWGPGLAYSRLLRFKSGTGVRLPSLAVECDVCESWTMESPTSFVFRLRDDVRWQGIAPVNARALVAEDIVFSYVRQGQPSSPNSPLLHNMAEVGAMGQLDLRITTRSQDADFFAVLADGHSKIVAREAVEVNGDLRSGPTIGVGPWILERSDTNDTHVFVRNPDYFDPGQPLLDGLRVHILPDELTRNASFLVGALDVHEMSPQTWAEYKSQTLSASPILIQEPGIGLEVGLKADRAPFDDARVRRAVFRSMDPYKAIDEHWGGFAFVSMGFRAYDPGWIPADNEARQLFARPGDAEELLREAGIKEPVPVTIKVGDFGEAFLAHAHAISVEMQSVGFDAVVEIVNRREFGESVWLGGDYEMFVGPPAPIASPNGYLLPVLHSDGIWNTTGHRDPELDALLEQQAVSLDPAIRAELIGRIQGRVFEQAYRFMPAAKIAIWAAQPRVQDFRPNFAGNEYHHWARVWVDGS